MNGMEMKGLYFGCDVFSGGGGLVTRTRAEGETCDVTLADGTSAILRSDGPKNGFYIQSPVKGLSVERYYPFSEVGNTFLKLAHGGIARAA